MSITYSGQVSSSRRTRWWITPGHWEVRARIERFAEAAVLLLLQEESRHGYDFLRDIPASIGERIDAGNLYRLLRGLEEDGLVESTWGAGVGPARRTYALTREGAIVLDSWTEALWHTHTVITVFLGRWGGEPNQYSADTVGGDPSDITEDEMRTAPFPPMPWQNMRRIRTSPMPMSPMSDSAGAWFRTLGEFQRSFSQQVAGHRGTRRVVSRMAWANQGGVVDIRTVVLPDRGSTDVLEVAGPLGAPTLVLLHGGLSTAAKHWTASMPLIGRSFRALAIDLRGYGRTSAQDVVALLDQLSIDRAVAVGYSMGTEVAEMLRQHYPHRLDGVVLCAATAVDAIKAARTDSSRVPVAVIVTGRDRLISPERQREMAQSIPDATVHTLDAGHFVCVNQPERFVPVLEDACRSVLQRSTRP
jgi:pimeloyl-ACP methyl ester carboxylesterase/DNA-binding PadR family transcriptional regulator